jgi:hypothetical protein
MHAISDPPDAPAGQGHHRWVGAALVGLGEGETRRAEHAARTGRHVLHGATRIEVLEVYCRRCRVRYSASTLQVPCAATLSRAG